MSSAQRVLDLSRLISRAGRLPTGVDRVERAYLDRFLADDVPLLGIVRTHYGYALLDRAGMAGLRDRLAGHVPWGATDRLSRWARSQPEPRQRAESDVRRLAIARALPQRLGTMLARHVTPGAIYFNTGHSNLTDRMLSALQTQARARVAVLIHDTIPLDFPQYQRSDTPERFAAMLRRVGARADWIIANSDQTARDITRHLLPKGRVPPIIIAHLGVDLPTPAADWPRPTGFDPNRPYFVTVGTIEPRKNHAFLLEIWAEITRTQPPDTRPQLLFCGSRGWNNAAVFARLDSDPMMGRDVFELAGLSDSQLAAAVNSAHALLFPSHAEGFGLPPVEAAMLGTPVICNDLAIYREVLGDIPVYAETGELYPWLETIMALVRAPVAARQTSGFVAPTWEAHFNTVLKKVG